MNHLYQHRNDLYKQDYLYNFNPEWTNIHLISLISDKEKYMVVWNSFSYSVPKFTKSFISCLHPQIKTINENISEYKKLINIKMLSEFYIIMYFTALFFFKDIYKHFNIDIFINHIEEEHLGDFYNSLISILDDEIISKHKEIMEEWILSFWTKRLKLTRKNQEKTELLDLIFKLSVNKIDKCIDIIKTTKYEQISDSFLYKIQEKKYDELTPQKVISILNSIISVETKKIGNETVYFLKDIIEKLIDDNKTI